ncbi:5191_t:CDS:10 [Ambispora leptoticha]|uniref:5191_t:CDS:1 n=1 Tax=Ambispora leptoticha TaxID=144679 RepID=A0A9N9AFW4_9GLOM|nr:5191_t:CDS:10 [Ambispora leptoticha]
MAWTKHEKAVSELNSHDPEVLVKTLRFIKNNIIGNKTKKDLYIGFNIIPKLVSFVDMTIAAETTKTIVSQGDIYTQVKIQAAIVLGSFAYGGEANVTKIVKSGGVKPLLGCIASTNDPKLIEAAARALKAIYTSPTADKNDIFQADHLHNLITLLNPAALNPKSDREKIASAHTAELAATIIARCCDTNDQQIQIAKAGAFPALVKLLSCGYAKAQEAALDALAYLCRENPEFGREIVQTQSDSSKNPVKIMLELIRDNSPTMRLIAARCLTHLSRDNAITEYTNDISLVVLPTLVKLLDEKGSVREEAPHVLAYLIRDNEELQKAACDADAVSKLAGIVTHVADEETSYYNATGDSDKLKEHALTALAAMSSLYDNGRKLVVDAKIIPHIVTAMSHKSYGVRSAACQLTKSLSRSVHILRTSLVDAGIAGPLFKLLSDESTDVQTIACATFCNMVLEFSPMKRTILELGGIEKLVELVHSPDNNIRLNAIWGLKNLICHAESDIKDSVMKILTYPMLAKLIDDPELDVQEQALNLLRNLASSKETDIEEVFKGLGEEKLMNIVEKKLCWSHPQIIKQTLYIISNIASGNERHMQSIMSRQTILKNILDYMTHEMPDIRLVAVWCLNNLTWMKDKHLTDTQDRVRLLRQLGFEEQVKKMANDEDLDVRERVKSAISQFSELS